MYNYCKKLKMRGVNILETALFVLAMASPAMCRSAGAPSAACQTLTPSHGVASQPESTNPYELDLREFQDPEDQTYYYIPGVTYTITLQANVNNPGTQFRGFLIQGRVVGTSPEEARGEFSSSTTDIISHNCNTQQLPQSSGVTHSSGSDKTSVTFQWTAPEAGTGTIEFAYTVVQVYSTFWANMRTMQLVEQSCAPPEYLTSTYCTETCPAGMIGNYSSGICSPFPSSALFANATSYFITFPSTLENTAILNITVYFDTSIIGPVSFFFVRLTSSAVIQRIFEFSNNFQTRQYGVNEPLPSFTTNGDLVSYQETIFVTSVIEDDLGFTNDAVMNSIPFALDTVDSSFNAFTHDTEIFFKIIRLPDPCSSGPCMNGGTCTGDTSAQSYICQCHPAYTDVNCSTLFDPCALNPCQNSAPCTNIDTSDYMCSCSVDFTGKDCETEINQCEPDQCVNGDCVDGVGEFTCNCNAGYTGTLCDEEINECDTIGCANGDCTDLINDFSCDCYPGWTGMRCDLDIDYCSLDPSAFGPCDDIGANACTEGNSTYMCSCAVGFTGVDCDTDILECETSLVCQNGGQCREQLFGISFCDCSGTNYTGTTCDVNLFPCNDEPCLNEGQCTNDGSGGFSCNCAAGFAGSTCADDLNVCEPNSCSNGGVCSEGLGLEFSCVCSPGFTGDSCETELPGCEADTCMNSGTCMELPDSTLQCNCLPGFTGIVCQTDINFCLTDPTFDCQNGGQCIEETGTQTSCDCGTRYTGDSCETEVCLADTCNGNGDCAQVNGAPVSCSCFNGFTGMKCETDIDVCQPDESPCVNGICTDGIGLNYLCDCSPGYSGTNCENDLDYCETAPTFNCGCNGVCVERPGTLTACECSPGFGGDSCATDLDYCGTPTQAYNCMNGGTCVEGIGTSTSCVCLEPYSGDSCENDVNVCVPNNPCVNGGSCTEGPGFDFICNCPAEYTGDRCQTVINFTTGSLERGVQNLAIILASFGAFIVGLLIGVFVTVCVLKIYLGRKQSLQLKGEVRATEFSAIENKTYVSSSSFNN